MEVENVAKWDKVQEDFNGPGCGSCIRGVEDIAMIGVAKGIDRDAGKEEFHRIGQRPFALKRNDPVLYFVQRLRDEDLFKRPGVAETIDWAKCLLALDVVTLSPEVIADTLGAILKYQDDIQKIEGSEAKKILDDVRKDLAPA